VRSHLTTLEEKGHVKHEKDGAKYVFIPTVHPKAAKRSAIRHLIRTFFGGSREQAVAALLDGWLYLRGSFRKKNWTGSQP
jgi:predicted transcriptional regulator